MRGMIFVAAVSAAIFFGVPALTYAATLAKPANNLGLVGYWHFNEGVGTAVGDYSGNKNSGTASNLSWTSGRHGQAGSFNGSNSSVLLTSPSQPTGEVTVSAWVYKNAHTAWSSILDRYGGENLECLSFGFDSTNGQKLMFMADGTSPGWNAVTANSVVPTGQWVHVAASSNGSTVTFYVNGVADGTQSSVAPCTTGNFYMGVNLAGGDEYFNGLMDDVRLYSRALTAAEIASLYRAGEARGAGQVSSTGLLGYWPFDQSGGSQALDRSGNNRHGTLVGENLPTWSSGKYNNALTFGVANNYVTAAVTWPSSGTIALWAYPTASADWISPAGWKVGSPTNYALIDEGNAQKWRAVFKGNSTPDEVNISSATNISFNTWQHVVMSWDKSGSDYTVRLYVNGASQGSATWSGTAASSWGNFRVGNSGDFGDNFFSGRVDDVRVYSRALSAAEVAALYQNTAAKINVDTTSNNPSLTSGLVGYWSFNGADVTDKVYDRAGTNHGYIIAGATSTVKSIGKVGQGLNLNGTTYVNAGTSDTANITGTISLSAWIKTSNDYSTSANWAPAISRLSVSTGGYDMGIGGSHNSASNKAYFNVGTSYIARAIKGTSQINDGKWHHLVGVYDGTNSYIYVDGVLENSGAKTAQLDSPGTSLYLGQSYNAGIRFTGSLDELRIYNRALTAAEVKALYMAGK